MIKGSEKAALKKRLFNNLI